MHYNQKMRTGWILEKATGRSPLTARSATTAGSKGHFARDCPAPRRPRAKHGKKGDAPGASSPDGKGGKYGSRASSPGGTSRRDKGFERGRPTDRPKGKGEGKATKGGT